MIWAHLTFFCYDSYTFQSIREGLARKGHKFRAGGLCVVQLIKNICNIEQDDNTEKYCVRAASDVRKGGAPDGY